MKIEYKDGSYLEIKKINEKIQLTISARNLINNQQSFIVNSVLLSKEEFEKILNEIETT